MDGLPLGLCPFFIRLGATCDQGAIPVRMPDRVWAATVATTPMRRSIQRAANAFLSQVALGTSFFQGDLLLFCIHLRIHTRGTLDVGYVFWSVTRGLGLGRVELVLVLAALEEIKTLWLVLVALGDEENKNLVACCSGPCIRSLVVVVVKLKGTSLWVLF